MKGGPVRLLTDWTTSAGVDGTGLLALVVGGRVPDAIHLATLGYEVFVLHADDAAADTAEVASHVHHVVADAGALPAEWLDRFDLVVAIDAEPAIAQVAPAGLLLVVSTDPFDAPDGLDVVLHEHVEDPQRPSELRHRTVLARLA